MIHTVKGFSIVSETEVDVFLEFSWFLYDPANVGNFIPGSSAFSKPSLDIWKFSVQVMLKPSMQVFEHDLSSMGDKCNCLAHSLVLLFLGIGIKIDFFLFCCHCCIFQTCWYIEWSTLIASVFRILNSSAGISSPALALLIAVLSKAHLTSHSRMSGSGWMTTPLWLSGSLKSFLYSSSMYFFHLLISSASIRSTVSVLYCAHLWKKCSFDISNFLEDVSSLSPSVVFLYYFALFTEEGLLVSLLFSGTLPLVGCTLPFLLWFLLLFFPQLFVKPPQITTLPYCFSFSLGWICTLLLYNIMDLCP